MIIVVCYHKILLKEHNQNKETGGHRDRMIVGFTTTYAISAYHH